MIRFFAASTCGSRAFKSCQVSVDQIVYKNKKKNGWEEIT